MLNHFKPLHVHKELENGIDMVEVVSLLTFLGDNHLGVCVYL